MMPRPEAFAGTCVNPGARQDKTPAYFTKAICSQAPAGMVDAAHVRCRESVHSGGRTGGWQRDEWLLREAKRGSA